MAENTITARLAVEYWKLLRAFERALERVPEEHKIRIAAQAKFSAGRLESIMREAGLNLATFDGQTFEPNLPVAAINGSDFDDEVGLVIETTVEPAVIEGMQVLAMGKVILTKRNSDHASRD
jgi:hypothetical protein